MANIANGKSVLRGIIDDIMASDDTEEWDVIQWEQAITDALEDVREDRYGTSDLADLMAYVIDCYSGDYDQTAGIVCYGIPWSIANSIDSANSIGERPYILG